jgi:MoaA/NifB/PqqE/SkfB family radical SAM enzyme
MLTGIHFLMTYRCIFECDHCFLFCGPHAQGTFTLKQIKNTFNEMKKIGTIKGVYFEGGEPFLYYPIVLEGLKIAKKQKLKAGIVTNAYWATSVEDAKVWLEPLKDLKITDLSVSDDAFHSSEEEDSPAKRAIEAAKKLGLPVDDICIEGPSIQQAEQMSEKEQDQTSGQAGDQTDKQAGGQTEEQTDEQPEHCKGEPVIGGDVRFRGRAVDKLSKGLPTKPWQSFKECSDEELEHPQRVHIDAFGNVQVCQGLSIGNMNEKPLSEIIKNYDAHKHPICGPLLKGGPVELAREYNVEHEDGYIDACHFCYQVRRALINQFPQYLAPRLVYGFEEEPEPTDKQTNKE